MTHAARVLARIEQEGFDRTKFLAAAKAHEQNDNVHTYTDLGKVHPSNWMTEEEVMGPVQDEVLLLLFASE